MDNNFGVISRASEAILYLILATIVSGVVLGVMNVSGPFEGVVALITDVRLLLILLVGTGVVLWVISHDQFGSR
ncbi:hypothetical protein SAMN05443661_10715 [Natronobacterium gregoryi]|uniref:Uncharacterized protein n=2 Tax=Natronobacterium gregoryi TaxID=44930 RepID=L0ABZ2_NATGS|nr:hypothetical protein Natgr_0154 [Natronobacterium gregoryi SP2]SFI84264.1 hypothetical protein SAMN05443661_10715 [Natronobacterium gregoryi]